MQSPSSVLRRCAAIPIGIWIAALLAWPARQQAMAEAGRRHTAAPRDDLGCERA